MKKEQLEALLGRSLTPNENTNLKKYLSIATEQLEEAICTSLEYESDKRIYESRDGYSTLFTDIFTEVNSITVNDEAIEPSEYHVSFFDKRNSKYYNSIVFKNKLRGEDIEVNADWGFDCLPDDLGTVFAQLFALAGKKKTVGKVKSKRVEDFQITYGDATDMQQLLDDNAETLNKYSICDLTATRSGRVCGVSYHERV